MISLMVSISCTGFSMFSGASRAIISLMLSLSPFWALRQYVMVRSATIFFLHTMGVSRTVLL